MTRTPQEGNDMAWHAYRLVYRLESPLHIGWRKIGNLMQTRLYVPGRNWWGAATAHLTQWLDYADYHAMGEFVRQHLIFGYFFLADHQNDGDPFIPRWDRRTGTVSFGTSYSADEFERRFVSSLASAAIDHQSNTAAEGQLHEVEFVVPRVQQTDRTSDAVFLVGYLFGHEGEYVLKKDGHTAPDKNILVQCKDQDVCITYLSRTVSLLEQVLSSTRLGGERRYGFGQMRFVTAQQDVHMFGCPLHLTGDFPRITVGKDTPVPAHMCIHSRHAIGEIEPFLGREWHQDRGPGNTFSEVNLCWMPGAVVQEEITADILSMGILGNRRPHATTACPL